MLNYEQTIKMIENDLNFKFDEIKLVAYVPELYDVLVYKKDKNTLILMKISKNNEIILITSVTIDEFRKDSIDCIYKNQDRRKVNLYGNTVEIYTEIAIKKDLIEKKLELPIEEAILLKMTGYFVNKEEIFDNVC